MPDETTETAQVQSGTTGNQTGTQSGQTGDQTGQSGVTFNAEQQAHLNELLKKEKEEAKKAARKEYETKQQQEKEAAEQARLKEQQEWKTLADQHEAKVKELEPQVTTLTEQVKEYDKAVGKLLDDRLTALGEQAKNAVDNLPGKPNSLAKLQWLNANEALFKQAPQTPAPAQTPAIGTPQTRRSRFTAIPAPSTPVPVNELEKPLVNF